MFPKYEHLNNPFNVFLTEKSIKFFPTRIHNHLEIGRVVEGTLNVMIDGENHTLQNGDLYIVFPNLPHSVSEGNVSVQVTIASIESYAAYHEILTNFKPDHPILYAAEIPSVVYSLLNRILEIHKSNLLHKQPLINSYFSSLVGEILNLCRIKKRDSDNQLVQQLLQYFLSNFTKEITLDDIARDLNYSKYYISHVISENFQCNFRSLINSYRISMAQNLLLTTQKSACEIAKECGFKNQSSFNRAFTNLTSLTPSQFRKQDIHFEDNTEH